MDTITNKDRSGLAQQAVEAFATATGMEAEPEEAVIGDLLCDLMHYCEQNGVEFDDCLGSARMHYSVGVFEDIVQRNPLNEENI